jgi:hypothetical protein
MIAKVNIPPIKRLTTQNARKITLPFSIQGCCIVMSFKLKNGFTTKTTDVVVYEWKTSDDSIEILSDTEIILKEKQILAVAGTYIYDFIISFPSGEKVSYFEGEQVIQQNVSVPC